MRDPRFDPVKMPYPMTLLIDRYRGVYSGARFPAFNLERSAIPEAVGDDDLAEAAFWCDAADRYRIGKGDTPDEAVLALAAMCGF